MNLASWSASPTARFLFWAAALFALVMALLPHPPRVPGDPSDKIQHVMAFATLGLLGAFAYPRAAKLKLLVGLSLFGAAVELGQAIPALNRDSSLIDWIADTVAAGLLLLAAGWWQQRSGGAA